MREVLSFISSLEPMKTHDRLAKMLPFLWLSGFSKKETSEIAQQYSQLINESKLFPSAYRRYCTEWKISCRATTKECCRVFQDVYDSQCSSNRYYGTVVFDLLDWNAHKEIDLSVVDEFVKFISENADNLRAVISLPNDYRGNLLALLSEKVCIHTIKRETSISVALDMFQNELLDCGIELADPEVYNVMEKCVKVISDRKQVSEEVLRRMAGEIAVDKLVEKANTDKCVFDNYLKKLQMRNSENASRRKIGF